MHSEGLRIASVQHASQQLQGCMDRVSELEGYNEALSEQLRTDNVNFTTVQLERARIQHEICQMQSLHDIALEKCRQELAISKAEGARWKEAHAKLDLDLQASTWERTKI